MISESPRTAGAYLLLIDLESALRLRVPPPPRMLSPGRYVYCGSARGPGGIAARVRRHLRRDKAVRWHVDRLTAAGRVVAVVAAPGEPECALCRRLLAVPGAEVPVPGFGSSDCRRCPAHLVAVPTHFAAKDITALL
jgi:Uri superfamily endonuclease